MDYAFRDLYGFRVKENSQLMIHNIIRDKQQAYESLLVNAGQAPRKLPMDLIRLNDVIREINGILPKDNILLYVLTDLQTQLTLPQSTTRVQRAITPFLINFTGRDAAVVSATVQRIVSIGDPVAQDIALESMLDALSHLEDDSAVYSQMFLFLASQWIQDGHIDRGILLLKRVVKRGHPDWASLAQCQIGYVYEIRGGDQDKAREAYQATIKNFPESLDAETAREGLKRL